MCSVWGRWYLVPPTPTPRSHHPISHQHTTPPHSNTALPPSLNPLIPPTCKIPQSHQPTIPQSRNPRLLRDESAILPLRPRAQRLDLSRCDWLHGACCMKGGGHRMESPTWSRTSHISVISLHIYTSPLTPRSHHSIPTSHHSNPASHHPTLCPQPYSYANESHLIPLDPLRWDPSPSSDPLRWDPSPPSDPLRWDPSPPSDPLRWDPSPYSDRSSSATSSPQAGAACPDPVPLPPTRRLSHASSAVGWRAANGAGCNFLPSRMYQPVAGLVCGGRLGWCGGAHQVGERAVSHSLSLRCWDTDTT